MLSERRYGPFLAGAAYGWARKNKAADLAKIPRIQSLGLEATLGLALAWGVSDGILPSGWVRRGADHIATALLSIAGMRLGEGDFAMTALQGAGDELAGMLEGDEDLDLGDDDDDDED